ncbi:MAG TPA: cell division protein ZapA [Alphaproteobacteria bacterium]|nr:cell division protein ZapA [Alphaproteobacteria bacterium]HNS44771.1 cell division protein ZapA [Alphaproteobacteria bacterium]
MGEINLNIDGRNYPVACDDGQEERVFQLGNYVDGRLQEVAGAAAGSKSQAMMLTTLLLADEVFDLKEQMKEVGKTNSRLQNEAKTITYQGLAPTDEQEITTMISRMTARIEQICNRARKVA